MAGENCFAAIDLKSFYASVECVERGLDPLTANLVVADAGRTEKTICLAVSPAMKRLGLPGRCRLFEVVQKAREVERRTGRRLDYVVAPPRMRLYMDISARIYEQVYLKYVDAADIHVYSVDEVFIDLTHYLSLYGLPAHDLVRRIIRDILALTGITATAGIGTNLYLAKVAMDIVAKRAEADGDGVRIAELDELSYRRQLWEHEPITDFWRVGRGISGRLAKHGMFTMGDVARMSLADEELLYREFGVDAELLIDHAWGAETCRMEDIKRYRPEESSVSVGQVLACAYPADKGRLIVREMADGLAMDLVAKGLAADSVSLFVGYEKVGPEYEGEMEADWYGRHMRKPGRGSAPLTDAGGARIHTSSSRKIVGAAVALYDRIVDPRLRVRRFYLALGNVRNREKAEAEAARQMDMFTDAETLAREAGEQAKEARIQQALLEIREKYGRNAILRGTSYEEGATARERNRQIGGHAAGEED